MVRQFPLATRRILAGLLAAAGAAYGALLVATYLYTTAPSALGPSLSDVHRLLFNEDSPISPMQRRLEASDTPLGTGPLISSESVTGKPMRFAFTGLSNEDAKPLSTIELAQREGERLALLDWIRSGASRLAYERDDHALTRLSAVTSITPEILVSEVSAASTSPHVRIRSLINERCVTCHNEEDGDDTARLIPFNSYETIARYLVLDDQGRGGRSWVAAALISLFPLAAFICPAFALTSYPSATRKRLLAATMAALIILSVCWLAGSLLAPLLLASAIFAIICIELQMLASVAQLLGKQTV